MIISSFDIRVQAVYGIKMEHPPAIFVVYIYNRAVGKRFERVITAEPVLQYKGIWIIQGEIHHLSGVWKSQIRFVGNRVSVKKEIALSIKPYNEAMHQLV